MKTADSAVNLFTQNYTQTVIFLPSPTNWFGWLKDVFYSSVIFQIWELFCSSSIFFKTNCLENIHSEGYIGQNGNVLTPVKSTLTTSKLVNFNLTEESLLLADGGFLLQVQFVLTMLQTSCAVVWPCGFPMGWLYFQITYMITLILLFANFYVKVNEHHACYCTKVRLGK